MKLVTFSIVSILVALAGLSTAALWLFGDSSARVSKPKEEMVLTQEVIKQAQELEFNEVSNKKGSTEDGVPFSARLFESSDGLKVSVWRENHDSAVGANQALRSKVKRAVTIIKRQPKLDDKGQRIGERVSMIIALAVCGIGESLVLWTSGSRLYYIESSSVKHGLEIEKRFYQ